MNKLGFFSDNSMHFTNKIDNNSFLELSEHLSKFAEGLL